MAKYQACHGFELVPVRKRMWLDEKSFFDFYPKAKHIIFPGQPPRRKGGIKDQTLVKNKLCESYVSPMEHRKSHRTITDLHYLEKSLLSTRKIDFYRTVLA